MEKVQPYNFYPFVVSEEKFKKIVYKNRCVIIPILNKEEIEAEKLINMHVKLNFSMNFMRGYVVLKKTDIPKDWWGNLSAPGLQKLMIHGGLTYCEQKNVPNQDKIEAEYFRKLKKLYESEKTVDVKNVKTAISRIDKRTLYHNKMNAELSKSNEGYVVFGFDCGHHGDFENEHLKDPNHVMILTEQMEQQLLKFAERYEDYKNAEGVVKNVVQKAIMDEVRRDADIQCEMSFDAMLDILSGKDED